ncbi:MAG: hypothetical protein G01um10143_108 [Parcubacteria group bacterium Gr01-1014_3]|nr:MAG: hypothetical protein G01um10143_108 [Parcubacteria group bacterium Gr01-1014_3]
MDSKNSYQKFLGIFLGVMLVIGGGYWLWDGYLSSAAKARRFVENQVEQIEKAEKAYIAAMTADTYGGKTPKETLDLFVAALKKGDIDLASKYFLLDENLSREKWVSHLVSVKEAGLLNKMASDITLLAKEVRGSDPKEAAFEILNSKGIVSVVIDMRLNEYSKLWKIESL